MIFEVVEAGVQRTYMRVKRSRVYDFVWVAVHDFLAPFIQIRQ
jgi:hypothetical protein